MPPVLTSQITQVISCSVTDRRQVLQLAVLVAGVAALPACGSGDDSPSQEPSATPDAQQSLELTLIAAYDAALPLARPNQAAVYQRIRDEHAEHLRALGWSTTSPTNSSAQEVGRKDLLRAERRAARQHSLAARDTADPDRAQLLALIAASESQHIADLGGTGE